LEYLSDKELYFTSLVSKDEKYFILTDDEFHHSAKVMRNKIGDRLFATNGNGKIFEGKIISISKDELTADINNLIKYKNELEQFTFCIPNLKNPERFKFAIEKCVELGITNFIFYHADHSINKKFNKDRIEKIVLASMKQSLRAYLPKIKILLLLKDLPGNYMNMYLFDQFGKKELNELMFDKNQNHLFVFGPEGGFSENEFILLKNSTRIKLAENRLRSETAIVKAASLLS
jgi:16S rRNA (uracil1498-N3)-methyltransferase